jgi:hypothetical protein
MVDDEARPDDKPPRPYLELGGPQSPYPDSGPVTPTVRTPEKLPRPYLEIDTDGEQCTAERPHERNILLDLTPLSCKSTGSAAEYHQPNQTIIIFDWDDTLCPSTTCMRHHGLSVVGERPTGQVLASLQDLTRQARELLEAALELAAEVVVVTNAEEGWIELSCKQWLPGLEEVLSSCQITSARSTWEPQGVASPAGWKTREFNDVIDRFYSQYPSQSWKNIISIGDAPHEREALSRVSKLAPQLVGSRCRSKSVKFVLRPTIEQLRREMQMLRSSLRDIVWHDDDLDLHFSAESLAEPLEASSMSDRSGEGVIA